MEKSPDSCTEFYNGTEDRHPNISASAHLEEILSYLLILLGFPGIIGNGIVIRHLAFKMKRNSVTVYILNLALADSGTLIFLFLAGIRYLISKDFLIELTEGFIWTYCIGQLLLTVISFDRCLSLFFPIWYQYHQSTYLSTTVCVITWINSFFIYAFNYALFGFAWFKGFPPLYHILICTSVCVPLMLVSSLALFIKGYLKSQMKRQGKLLTAILLALFCFLIFSFPLIAIYIINVISNRKCLSFIPYGYLYACLNSSIKASIYFLLGRKKEHTTMCNLQISLQRLFEEEEEEENEKHPEVQVVSQLQYAHEKEISMFL
ncbi:proto-oncogene Mas-like [Protobothrops mucrosquamatus]|uniref:proto-oncogene Mas-like n=1 Tax=Protobothrops mucrosquamatus TaxID=103944 RepID=UPI000775953E|nr:proto-oncogene Mas-like [Protobothrops mucrosquamatus]